MVTYQAILYSLLFYLAGFCIFLIVRKKWDESLIGLVSPLISIIGLLFTIDFISNYKDPIHAAWHWFELGKYSFKVELIINPLTLLLLFLVQCIGTLVQLYSTRYMRGDTSYGRYFAYLNLFLFAMIGIVISGNLFQLFFFWELVSVSSYLLIGFWYERKAATKASLKAFVVNRIGDIGFLFGIFSLLHTTGSTSLATIATSLEQIDTTTISWIGILFLLGALGKSAQFPLQIWLPDAMEGPTPASALIHAATMVVAGLFILARLDFLITPINQYIFIGIGLFTAILAALSASAQFDVKKVLAYSTISQIGLMLVGIGVGCTSAALLHLTTHAFFKAGLFLAAGSIIHLFHHQDMRRMGGIIHSQPYLFFTFGICSAALAGFPLLSGFLSKDTLLLATVNWAERQTSPYAWLVPFFFLIVSAITAFYISRQVYLIFLNRKDSSLRADLKYLFNAIFLQIREIIDTLVAANNEDNVPQHSRLKNRIKHTTREGISVGILAFFSLFFVFSLNPLDAEKSWFFDIFPLVLTHNAQLPYLAAALTLFSTLLGYEWTKSRYGKGRPYPEPPTFWQQLRQHHFFLDFIYGKFVTFLIIHLPTSLDQKDTNHVENTTVGLSYVSKITDEKGIERIIKGVVNACLSLGEQLAKLEYHIIDGGVRFIYRSIGWIGKRTKQIQGGAVQLYVSTMFLFILIFILVLIISI